MVEENNPPCLGGWSNDAIMPQKVKESLEENLLIEDIRNEIQTAYKLSDNDLLNYLPDLSHRLLPEEAKDHYQRWLNLGLFSAIRSIITDSETRSQPDRKAQKRPLEDIEIYLLYLQDEERGAGTTAAHPLLYNLVGSAKRELLYTYMSNHSDQDKRWHEATLATYLAIQDFATMRETL